MPRPPTFVLRPSLFSLRHSLFFPLVFHPPPFTLFPSFLRHSLFFSFVLHPPPFTLFPSFLRHILFSLSFFILRFPSVTFFLRYHHSLFPSFPILLSLLAFLHPRHSFPGLGSRGVLIFLPSVCKQLNDGGGSLTYTYTHDSQRDGGRKIE